MEELAKTLKSLYELELKQRNFYFQNILGWYYSVLKRYNKFGVNFSFPEFEPIIMYLEVYLDGLGIDIDHALFYQYIFLKQQLAQVKQKTTCSTFERDYEMGCKSWEEIKHNETTTRDVSCKSHESFSIMEENICVGEYEVALNGNNYPYAYSLRVILNIMDFFEIWYRYSFQHNKETTKAFLLALHKSSEMSYCDGIIVDLAVTGYLDLRYRDDYYFYLEYLLENKENRPFSLLFPSVNKMGATEIQMLRSTPIHPVGISVVPVFADLSIMSQTNFLWHDINHARRNVQQNSYYLYRFMGNFGGDVRNYFYEMFIFQQKILKIIKVRSSDDKFNKNMKRWMKLIIFDTVHEDAMPYLPEVIINNTLKPSSVCYPFENPNLVCGNNNKRIISKFHGLGAATLAIMFTKLRYEFYEKTNPIEFILHADYRTTFHLSIAVIELIKIILRLSPHIEFLLKFDGIRKFVIGRIIDKTNTERGILKPLEGLPEDTDPERDILPGTPEYNWISMMNKGQFPTNDYSLVTYSDELKYRQDYAGYTRFKTEIDCFWKTSPPLQEATPEFNNQKYIENQAMCKININEINIKNVKEISPKIDLTVLNKWRNMYSTPQAVAAINVKGKDPDEQPDIVDTNQTKSSVEPKAGGKSYKKHYSKKYKKTKTRKTWKNMSKARPKGA